LLTSALVAHVPPARSRLGKPEPAARPAFVAVLLLVVVLTFVMDPLLGLALVGMSGVAALMQRSDVRR
jgi:hypothetical protein